MMNTQQKRLLQQYEEQLDALSKELIAASAKARKSPTPMMNLLEVASKAKFLVKECVGIACWASVMAGQERVEEQAR